jgi:hypothetical protein
MKGLDKKTKTASLRMPFASSFLASAMEFAAKGAQAFGYTDRVSSGLMLAVEELFTFYLSQAAPASMVEINLEDQGYRMALSISFRAADPDLRPFNLTWRVSHDSEASLDTLGPMIAARMVSSLRLEFAPEEQIIIHMTRDREYTKAHDVPLPLRTGKTLRISEPGREDLHHFAAMAATALPKGLPIFLAHPAMGADMLTAGRLSALLIHSGEWIVGGVLWRPISEGCLELFGPYLFCQDPGDSALTALLDETVSRVSRSPYRGLLRRQGPLAGYERFFDYLGEVRMNTPEGSGERQVYYFRHLLEETGAIAYGQGSLTAFLEDQYQRLCLPRQLRESAIDLQRLSETSVLTAELNYARSLAIIHPLRPGRDMTANLSAHLAMFADQGIDNVLMEINVAKPNEAVFCGALEETGFRPRLLIPDAVLGDLVVYSRADRDVRP